MNVDKARKLLREMAESLPNYERELGQLQTALQGEFDTQDLRDRFAIAALNGMLCAADFWDPEGLTRRAYQIADLMLIARKSAGAEAPEQEPPQGGK